jgi:multidrug efflux pump subunit AcrA (membrane-fusion protein)
MPEIFSTNGAAAGPLKEMKDVVSQRSELMEEIVSNKPGFLLRWGNLFFFLILILVGVACWFIKYPDIIYATAKLTSVNAPKPIVSLLNSKLVKLHVSENQQVNKGDVLGFIESTADHEEVSALAASLDTVQILVNNAQADKIRDRWRIVPTQLGELQLAYQTFSQAFLSFDNYLMGGFYLKKKAMLLSDKENLQKMHKNLNEQRELQEQDLALVQKTFDANQSLKNEKVISDFDYRLEQSKLIGKKLTLPQIKSGIIANQSQQIEKEKEILELENSIQQQRLIFQQALHTFKSQVDEWKKKYILIAPISGKVAFASFIQVNQQLEANQTICYINPENSEYFAEVIIPQSNFGKVAIGQLVLLKFQSYPFQEFGAVQGKIEFISHIPGDSGYLAKVGLVNGLATNYRKPIQYRDGLLANAEVITQDMRLLERFYYSFLKQIKR